MIYVAIHDYQHGGVGMLVKADDPGELKQALGCSWDVITEKIEEHPFYKYAQEKGDTIYDLDEPKGLLFDMLYISARQSEGKTGYPVRINKLSKFHYREIWARTIDEVREKFPNCEFLYGKVLTKPLPKSDIDIEDDFIKSHGSKNT